MVKIIEHKGLHMYLDASVSSDIHVMGSYHGKESLGVLEINMGYLERIRILESPHGKRPLPSKVLVEFEDLLSLHAEEIISLWSRLVSGYGKAGEMNSSYKH